MNLLTFVDTRSQPEIWCWSNRNLSFCLSHLYSFQLHHTSILQLVQCCLCFSSAVPWYFTLVCDPIDALKALSSAQEFKPIVTCAWYTDSVCQETAPNLVPKEFQQGICYASTVPSPSELTILTSNLATVCFFSDAQCTEEITCLSGGNGQCVILGDGM